MAIPVFIVTGFLSAGKTTFLNHLLNGKKWESMKLLVIQFESGEEEFQSRADQCRGIVFSRKALEENPAQLAQEIADKLHEEQFEEIWIEWNGMIPLDILDSMLLHPTLRKLCKVRKVIHIADGDSMEGILGRTGNALPDQIAGSDLILVRSTNDQHHFNTVRQLLHGINSKAEIIGAVDYEDFLKELYSKRGIPIQIPLIFAAMAVIFHSVFGVVAETIRTPFNTFLNLFSGIMLQAIPFLLIGVLLSSVIQILIPQEFVERRFPKSVGAGILAAVICGFCLPVCDCASIPIFRSLIKKGVPLPAAVTFLTVTPVINPVVILSTYYAFGGNLGVVISRVCFGIIAAVLIGTGFALFPPKERILSEGFYDRLACNCGCGTGVVSGGAPDGKIFRLLRHSQTDFFNVGKYLVMGAFLSSVLQTFGSRLFGTAHNGAGLAVSIMFMMVLAFLLSLCSSSDAVIARSLSNQLPMGAVMGFLVFGPMMDLKNVLMLSASFSKRFIARLIGVTFSVCFVVVFLFSQWGGL